MREIIPRIKVSLDLRNEIKMPLDEKSENHHADQGEPTLNLELPQCPFALLQIEPTYCIDLKLLDEQCLALQKVLHPDLFPRGSFECQLAESYIQVIHESMVIIKDPLLRAKAILDYCAKSTTDSHDDVSVLESGVCVKNPKLMMEAMELKEALEEAKHQKTMLLLLQDLHLKIHQVMTEFQNYFEQRDQQALRLSFIQLSFLVKTYRDGLSFLHDTDWDAAEKLKKDQNIRCQSCIYLTPGGCHVVSNS